MDGWEATLFDTRSGDHDRIAPCIAMICGPTDPGHHAVSNPHGVDIAYRIGGSRDLMCMPTLLHADLSGNRVFRPTVATIITGVNSGTFTGRIASIHPAIN